MNDVRVFRTEIINRAGRRSRQTRLISRSRLNSGQVYRDFSARIPRVLKPSYSGNPATGCTQRMVARPFALIADFSSGVTHNINQRVLI